MTNNHYAITGRLTCTPLTTQDVGEQLQIDTIPNISFFKKAVHIFTPVGMTKGAQSSTSNISSPSLIQRSLGPEEGDLMLWIVRGWRKGARGYSKPSV